MNCQYCGIKTENNTQFCSHSCSTTFYNKNIWKSKKVGKCKDCNCDIISRRKYCNQCWATFLNKPRKRVGMNKKPNCDMCGILKTKDNTLFADGLYKRICRKCDAAKTKAGIKNIKEKCVLYKGGKCAVCGYSKYLGALEFHHLDPTQKDFSIASKKSCKFDDKIKSELDKCVLLCSNCHREEHHRLDNGMESLVNKTIIVNNKKTSTENIHLNLCSSTV